jgi:SAM-dependent methyltransferase
MQNTFGSRMLTLSRGFMHSRVFLTAIELGLFRALGTEQLDAPALAERIGADPRALEVLLNALVSMSLLEKREGRFCNAPLALQALEADGGSDFDAFIHAACLWEKWSELTNIVRGQRPKPPALRPGLARASALAMRQYAQGSADTFAQAIDASRSHHLLDIGGGVGTLALALAIRHPQLHALVFDSNAAALEIAKDEIAAKLLGERVATRLGDFMTDDLGSGYDLVLLSSVLCLLSERENRALLARVQEAMVPGGRIVIRDAILDPAGTAPPQFALFSVHMLVATDHGKAYTGEEIIGWLSDAGLTGVHHMPLQDARLVLAEKPG